MLIINSHFGEPTRSTRCGSSGCRTIFRNNVAAVAESVRLGLKQCSHDNLLLLLLQSPQISSSPGHGIACCIVYISSYILTQLMQCSIGKHTDGLQTFAPWNPLHFMATLAAMMLLGPGVVLCFFAVLGFLKNIAVWDVNKN